MLKSRKELSLSKVFALQKQSLYDLYIITMSYIRDIFFSKWIFMDFRALNKKVKCEYLQLVLLQK